MVENSKNTRKKEPWNIPKFFSLDVKKTESGTTYERPEDTSSYDPNTSP
jgi:hypothetical protein